MAAPVFDLQPMSIGDILDRTVRLYRRAFLHTLGIVSVPYLLIVPAGMGFGSALWATRDPRALVNPAVVAGIILLVLAFFWLNLASMGALARSVSERYLGRTPSLWMSYAPILRRSGSLIWAYFLAFLMAFGVGVLGIALFGVGFGVMQVSPTALGIGIFAVLGILTVVAVALAVRIFFRSFLVTQVIVIEDVRGRQALRRSWKLMRGNETRAFVISLFGGAVGYIVSLVLRLPTAILAGLNPGTGTMILDGVVGGVAQIVSIPFVSIPFTLLYYDSRIRQEAFDLEMMARNLGAAPRPAAAASAASPAARPAQISMADTLTAEPAGPGTSESTRGPADASHSPPRPPASPAGAAKTIPAASPPPRPPAGPQRSVGAFKVCPKCAAQVSLVRPTCPNCGTPVPFRSVG